MSLTSLPPVWVSWKPEDLENLTTPEIERLQILLRTKLVAVEDRFEYNLLFKNRKKKNNV
jgi:hypothetical protein